LKKNYKDFTDMAADIDIDFGDRSKILDLIRFTSARQENNNQVRRHNSGVYVTDIPYDPINDCSSIDYQEADRRGYFKIDLLNMSVYQLIRDPVHYEEMLARPVPWARLLEREFCEKIVHIGNHYDLICELKPDSIPRMAMFLAVIRPAKRHLASGGWLAISKDIWVRPEDDSYFFKKSHAVGYAQLVALHMNLIDEQDKTDLR
jgi:hypothetical protein